MTADDAPRKISLNRICHAYYKYKDLDKAVEWFNDFGFVEEKRTGDRVYFRGYGPEPWVVCAERADRDEFGGVGFAVDSEADLALAAEVLPGASPVHDLADAPGGGRAVTFRDPVDGFPFHLVYGQTASPLLDIPLPHTPVNYPREKNRPKNQFQRFQKRPAPVHKLGHWGHCTTNFAKTFAFYSKHFNLLPSDVSQREGGSARALLLC